MKLSIGDIIDRWTIAYLKKDRAGIDTVQEQYDYLEYCQKYDQTIISDYFKRLLTSNGAIWTLESDIRKGKEGELGLEEVGRRALQIRDINKERVQYKNELNERFNEGYKEIKVNHSSQ